VDVRGCLPEVVSDMEMAVGRRVASRLVGLVWFEVGWVWVWVWLS
jgi:hypothetical protein